MGKIRVLIVDDSSFVRKALVRIFSSDPQTEVAGTAATGHEAVEKVRSLRPDVMTLDISMPGMDGLETLRIVMETQPLPVLMLSQYTHQGAELTIRALELGAMDFVDKSSAGLMDFFDLAREILAKVKSIAGSRPLRIDLHSRALPPWRGAGNVDVICIGTSTGGPLALQMLLPKFPSDIPFSVLVVQHMPRGFIGPLAKRIDGFSAIHVKEAEAGEAVKPGVSYISPAGLHMRIKKISGQTTIDLGPEPANELHIPSVDVLFYSVAEQIGPRAVGVLLTGMGSDGVKGLRAIREHGGTTIAQDEKTAVMFGMPRVAIEQGIVDRVLPITSIAEEIMKNS